MIIMAVLLGYNGWRSTMMGMVMANVLNDTYFWQTLPMRGYPFYARSTFKYTEFCLMKLRWTFVSYILRDHCVCLFRGGLSSSSSSVCCINSIHTFTSWKSTLCHSKIARHGIFSFPTICSMFTTLWFMGNLHKTDDILLHVALSIALDSLSLSNL